MLPSIRHFFRFIELDEEFNKHGFRHKVRQSYFGGLESFITDGYD